ncbi:MAG: hypothetical protein JWO97_4392 [Acidobacteria bacterium]|nr:hypothetical protein [Acidobacteriota bacterium]
MLHLAKAMGHALERPRQLLESGAISFFYRPRVEEQAPHELDDVQRLLLVLQPDDSSVHRVIAIGRKRLPRAQRRERFWGYVDLVLYDRRDLESALDAQIYGTKTRGLRHLPAAVPAAGGDYSLEWHDDHAHLTYSVSRRTDDDVTRELELEREASYIVTVMNPDPLAWGLLEPPSLQQELFDDLETHVSVPAPFPPRMQKRFGDRRYAQLDTPEWLDHPGAELVFIATES